MKRTLIATALLAASTSAFSAEIVLFAGENFRGPRIQVESPVPNLARSGFNDLASSISVRRGTWQVCDDTAFRGNCVMLSEGEYPTLRNIGLNDRVSSVRDMQERPVAVVVPDPRADLPVAVVVPDRRAELPLSVPATEPDPARIAFYDRENFGGRGVTVTATVPDFNEISFNDRTRSVVVYSGTWELCHDMQFRGACQILEPGRYPQIPGGLDREISSARPVVATILESRPAVGSVGRVRAVLYEGPRFTGRSYIVDEDVLRNLDRTGFNDRASSLRVERGYWLFCSDAQLSGECMTFGPGEYPQLPRSLDNRVSSGRRISNDYPYREQPHWGS
jgi:hypothetical protein